MKGGIFVFYEDENIPRVEEINGELFLVDPQACAIIKVINKNNCRVAFGVNAERIEHFKTRISELGRTSQDIIIGIISVDDENGSAIADLVMPGFNWQEIRDRGEKPFARGLIVRDFMQEALELFDQEAADKLKSSKGISVVVIDCGVAEIYSV